MAGPAYDEAALQLGLLSGLTWLGWNKALDIVEHPDPAVRERERAALPWGFTRPSWPSKVACSEAVRHTEVGTPA